MSKQGEWRRVKSVALYDAGITLMVHGSAESHLFYSLGSIPRYAVVGEDAAADGYEVYLQLFNVQEHMSDMLNITEIWARAEGTMLSIRVDVENTDPVHGCRFRREILYSGAFSIEWAAHTNGGVE